MIQRIIDFFNGIVSGLNADYVLYGAAGLAVLMFIIMLIVPGYAPRFSNAAKKTTAYLKQNTGTDSLDDRMDAFDKPVRGAWKNYRACSNGTVPLYLTQSVCVDTPFANGGGRNRARNYFVITAFIAVISFLLNLLIIKGAVITAGEFIAPAAALILGAVFALILAAVQKARYKKALGAYQDLVSCLIAYMPSDNKITLALPVGATVHPEAAAEPAPENEGQMKFGDSQIYYGEEKKEPPVSGVYAPTPFTPPVYAGYAPKTEPPAYSAQRPYAEPVKEDVVAQIERITATGASKQTMLEVAKLLQAERAKTENKSPEQQRRLNSALATLLKAISDTNK